MKEIFHTAFKNGDLLGKKIQSAYMTDMLQKLILSNIPVKSVPIYGDWIEIDTVDDLINDTTLHRLKKI